jgi:hypothetical protein
VLTISGDQRRFRGGMSRRDFLRVGALGVAGPTLADLLHHEARAGADDRRPKSVIYIVLGGGPSHIDAWDMKPDAPDEFRGPFHPIATKLPGVRICEHMPAQAAIMNDLALVRGIRSIENDHFLSEVYTGLPRSSGHRPAFGSVVSRLAGTGSALPTYVSLSEASSGEFEYEKPYYAGPGHAPFRPFGDSLTDLNPVKNLDQLHDRKQLLTTFDALRQDLDRGDALTGMDRFQARALDMITSPKVRDAFDLSKEPESLLSAYGHKAGKYPHQTVKTILYDWDARPYLLARRLVEAGVRVVTVQNGDWDHHGSPEGDIFAALKMKLSLLDRSLCALIGDLKARGLDRDVLVVVLGEFGRTPKITPMGPGREHWAEAGCALFFGGGLKMGQVIGATDSRAERSKSGTIGFQNILATVYHVLGIDPSQQLTDYNGRPQSLLDDPEPVAELV